MRRLCIALAATACAANPVNRDDDLDAAPAPDATASSPLDAAGHRAEDADAPPADVAAVADAARAEEDLRQPDAAPVPPDAPLPLPDAARPCAETEGERSLTFGDADVYAHTATPDGEGFAVLWAEALEGRQRLMFARSAACDAGAAIELHTQGDRYEDLVLAPREGADGFHVLWRSAGNVALGRLDADGVLAVPGASPLNPGERVAGLEHTETGPVILVAGPADAVVLHLETLDRQVVFQELMRAGPLDALTTHGSGLAAVVEGDPCGWTYQPMAEQPGGGLWPPALLADCERGFTAPPVVAGGLGGSHVLVALPSEGNPRRFDLAVRFVTPTQEGHAVGPVTDPVVIAPGAGWVSGHGGLALAGLGARAYAVWSGAGTDDGYNGRLFGAVLDANGLPEGGPVPLGLDRGDVFAERPVLVANETAGRLGLFYVDRRSHRALREPTTGVPDDYAAELQFRWRPAGE